LISADEHAVNEQVAKFETAEFVFETEKELHINEVIPPKVGAIVGIFANVGLGLGFSEEKGAFGKVGAGVKVGSAVGTTGNIPKPKICTLPLQDAVPEHPCRTVYD
jgi:hypothetical protein